MRRLNYFLVFMALFVALRVMQAYSSLKPTEGAYGRRELSKRSDLGGGFKEKPQGVVLTLTNKLRQKIADTVRTQIHSPYRELILGMVLGKQFFSYLGI